MNRTASALAIALVAGTALGVAGNAHAGPRADGLNKVSRASDAVPAAQVVQTSTETPAGARTHKMRAATDRSPAFDAAGTPGTQVGYAPTAAHRHGR